MSKRITETKRTCAACNNIWFTDRMAGLEFKGKQMENFGKDLGNAGNDLMCCGGCWPAAFIPEKQKQTLIDPNKCPKCGSSANRKETVTHEI